VKVYDSELGHRGRLFGRSNSTDPCVIFHPGGAHEKLQVLDVIPFYLSAKTIDPIVHYFGDNKYKSVKWDEYIKTFEERKRSGQKKNIK